MVLAGMSYSGENYAKANVKAQATKYTNESQMLSGAFHVYASNNGGTYPASAGILFAENYIKTAPTNEWVSTSGGSPSVETVNVPSNVCESINANAGYTGSIPNCTDPGLPDSICCNNP